MSGAESQEDVPRARPPTGCSLPSVHFEVRDTGIGILPEARERLSGRSRKRTLVRRASTACTGLGLASIFSWMICPSDWMCDRRIEPW
jgi:signal transduction histidine kinase